MDKKIIITSDYDTYKQMIKEGFVFLGQRGKYYQFLNSLNLKNFSERVDQKQLMYTNKLCI